MGNPFLLKLRMPRVGIDTLALLPFLKDRRLAVWRRLGGDPEPNIFPLPGLRRLILSGMKCDAGCKQTSQEKKSIGPDLAWSVSMASGGTSTEGGAALRRRLGAGSTGTLNTSSSFSTSDSSSGPWSATA